MSVCLWGVRRRAASFRCRSLGREHHALWSADVRLSGRGLSTRNDQTNSNDHAAESDNRMTRRICDHRCTEEGRSQHNGNPPWVAVQTAHQQTRRLPLERLQLGESVQAMAAAVAIPR